MRGEVKVHYDRGCVRSRVRRGCLCAVDYPTHPHVFVEAGRLAEAFAAHKAFMRSMLFVNVENVNAQSVSFLK